MRSIIPLLCSFPLFLMPFAFAADNAYDIMVLEASTGKTKPATLAVHSTGKPGEIAFGKMNDGFFSGQRVIFRPLQISTRSVEVVIEDVESPISDNESGTTTQQVHKKIITLEADGKSHTVEVNGKKVTFRIYAIGGVGETNKIMIEQGAASDGDKPRG